MMILLADVYDNKPTPAFGDLFEVVSITRDVMTQWGERVTVVELRQITATSTPATGNDNAWTAQEYRGVRCGNGAMMMQAEKIYKTYNDILLEEERGEEE